MKKLMVAMSGGVDSSVALALLKDKYELLGVTLMLHEDSETDESGCKTCCSLRDVEDAKAVAAHFGIPHYVYNFKDRFKENVIDRFTESYLKGETPNPCIDCNRYIKFDEMLKRALSLGCDYIATGHYARTEFDELTGRYLLKKAVSEDGDNSKDQSYVLYNLTQEQLKHTIFPLGEIKKTQVRKIAEEMGLVNADKPDSQDICFVPDGNYAEFIKQTTGVEIPQGNFIDTDGNIMGKHNGIINYTIGQRRGIGVGFGKPMYVISKNPQTNEVVLGENDKLFRKEFNVRDLNWISVPYLSETMKVKAKTRYRMTEQPCVITPLPDGRVNVVFSEAQRAITPGQRAVFYDGDTVVGGGVIE